MVDRTTIAIPAQMSGVSDAVETFHRTSFEGGMTPTQAIALGIALAVLCGVALWVESRFTGRRLALIFWPLRVAVVAALMWMLLEPTDTTVQRRTEHKTLAIVADVSGSMETVDAADRATDYRWSHATAKSGDAGLIAHCDRLQLAAAEATAQLQALPVSEGRSFASETVRGRLATAERAGARAVVHLDQLAELSGTLTRSEAEAVAASQKGLTNDVLPQLKELQSDQPGTPPQARVALLHTLASKMDGIALLARRIAASTLEREAGGSGTPPASLNASQSRAARMRSLLDVAESTWIKEAEAEARIQRWTFGAAMTPVGANGWRSAAAPESQADRGQPREPSITDLSAALEQLGRTAAQNRVQGVVLLSDGRHNAAGARDPAELAASLGRLPFYIVPIGDDRLIRDVLVHHLDAPRAVAKDDSIVFESLVTAIDCEGERIEVQLLARDAAHRDEVIDRQTFTPDGPRLDHPVTFTTKRAETGRYEFAVRAVAISDEASDDNNQDSISVDVVETDIRLLLADSSPRWEFRFLSRLFERDEHVKYDQLIFHPTPAGTGELAETARLPVTTDEWARYRIAILGDLLPSQLSRESQEGLREFVVENGGTLILIAGTEAMPEAYERQPLGQLLPVSPGGAIAARSSYGVQMSVEGRTSAALQLADDSIASERVWQEAYRFAPLQWLSEFRQPKPTTHTLLHAVSTEGAGNADEDAFLCWQSVGRGRVVYFSAPASYLLRGRHGDRYHHAFWGQLLRWSIAPEMSAGSKTVRIRTDKLRYDRSEPIHVTVQLSGIDGTPVRLAKVQAVARRYEQVVGQVDLEGDPQSPGQYVGRFEQLPEGDVQIEPRGDDVKDLLEREAFTGEINAAIDVVRELSTEMDDTRSNPALLARIAELTEGHVIPPTAVAEVVQLADLAPQVTELESHQPVWNTWWCLAVISGCLIVEWIARKQMSLM